MNRLFSVFPNGRAGLGLLCLRLALLLAANTVDASTLRVQLALTVLDVMMIAGFLTPLACGVVVAVTLWTAGWSAVTGAPVLLDTLRVHGLLASAATALLLIGPGAYSVDARLFGWRELRMPDP